MSARGTTIDKKNAEPEFRRTNPAQTNRDRNIGQNGTLRAKAHREKFPQSQH
jgi:hypothetical protein